MTNVAMFRSEKLQPQLLPPLYSNVYEFLACPRVGVKITTWIFLDFPISMLQSQFIAYLTLGTYSTLVRHGGHPSGDHNP